MNLLQQLLGPVHHVTERLQNLQNLAGQAESYIMHQQYYQRFLYLQINNSSMLMGSYVVVTPPQTSLIEKPINTSSTFTDAYKLSTHDLQMNY